MLTDQRLMYQQNCSPSACVWRQKYETALKQIRAVPAILDQSSCAHWFLSLSMECYLMWPLRLRCTSFTHSRTSFDGITAEGCHVTTSEAQHSTENQPAQLGESISPQNSQEPQVSATSQHHNWEEMCKASHCNVRGKYIQYTSQCHYRDTSENTIESGWPLQMFSTACIRQTSMIADDLIYLRMINNLPMVGIHNQKALVNKTGTPLQDLVVLGGLIRISATDRSVTTRATAPIHMIDTLDHCLERK